MLLTLLPATYEPFQNLSFTDEESGTKNLYAVFIANAIKIINYYFNMLCLSEPGHSVMSMTPVEGLCHSVCSDRASPEEDHIPQLNLLFAGQSYWAGSNEFWSLHLRFITSPFFISVCLTPSNCTWTAKALPCGGACPS